jgi:hypothetical protein
MPEPNDKQLYEKVKEEIYKKYPKHSAYRSGLLVQEYKKRGGTYKGQESQTEGLPLWFASKWLNQRGEVGYKYKSDVYRPTVRVTKDTPVTFQELTKKEIERARKEKAKTGHVKRFKLSK